MLLMLNLPLVGIWVKLLKIPRPYLYAGILMFASLGSYAVNADPLDLVILLVSACSASSCAASAGPSHRRSSASSSDPSRRPTCAGRWRSATGTSVH